MVDYCSPLDLVGLGLVVLEVVGMQFAPVLCREPPVAVKRWGLARRLLLVALGAAAGSMQLGT